MLFFLISTHAQAVRIKWEPINERIIVDRFRKWVRIIIIILCYTPIDVVELQEKENFYSQKTIFQKVTSRSSLVTSIQKSSPTTRTINALWDFMVSEKWARTVSFLQNSAYFADTKNVDWSIQLWRDRSLKSLRSEGYHRRWQCRGAMDGHQERLRRDKRE